MVRQAAPEHLGLGGERLHGKQLDGGDAEPGEVLDGDGVGESRVGAAEVVGDARQPFGEVLDVDLVDHRLGERPVRRDVALPVERLVDHDACGARRPWSRGRPAARCRRPARPRPGGRRPTVPAGCRPRSRGRRGRAAAWTRCSADRSPAATDQRPGPRSAAPASPRAGARTRTRARAR